ncbi:MAG TPA: hypothetical protein EYP41_03045 [Anaerolineae bacterium]|nr:hypothetical protein [Anaerolineae bacterium]HIP72644.1 hypothetical protein [Anaerolineae bacterium]
MSEDIQQPLIPDAELPPEQIDKRPLLTADASIQAASGVFDQHMRDKGFALNTIKAFSSDVRLLGEYLGIGQPVGQIGTKDLNDFLDWLVDPNGRGVPCGPKSLARRITTLKVFFGWLSKTGVLTENPADAVIQRSVTSPLPILPTEEELDKSLIVAEQWRQGEIKKQDARPYLLLTLLLQTGIKKGEAMAIVPNHINREDETQPVLYIRYANPSLRYKERKLALDPEWLEVLDEYLEQYKPANTLFTCTSRNLEYILRDISDEAGLARGLLSFENLRWISALRDWEAGVEQDDIRQKLGLSKITWRETRIKLKQLSERRKKGDEEVRE